MPPLPFSRCLAPLLFTAMMACGRGDGLTRGAGDPNVAQTAPPASQANYSASQLAQDIQAVLQEHSGIYSDRPLGNPDNDALWTEDKVASLYQSLVITHANCYSVFIFSDFVHLLLAEAAAESTGDYNAGINGSAGSGWGLLQVTPDSVVVDYTNHGQALANAQGSILVDPNSSPNLADPGVNTLIWGWYGKNAVAFGTSADQAAEGERGTVVPDYGNVLLAWLAGPGHDRHSENNSNYNDYYDRNEDYFVQADFGSATDFTALMNTNVGQTPDAFH